MRIAGIHHIAHRSNRRRIEIDGGDSFSLDLSLVMRHGLCVGMELARERLDEILREDSRLRAKVAAFDMLRLRSFSRHEIAQRLRRKGFEADAVEYAVETLERLGYISDQQFAHEFVDSRIRSKPKGRHALRQELRRKGIDRATIDRTLASISDEDEREAAMRVARRQFARYRTLPHDVARRRLYQFLLRRGFAYDVVMSSLRELVGEEPPE